LSEELDDYCPDKAVVKYNSLTWKENKQSRGNVQQAVNAEDLP